MRWHSFCTPDGGHLALTAFVGSGDIVLKLTDGTVRHCWGARGGVGDTIDEQDDVNRVVSDEELRPSRRFLVNTLDSIFIPESTLKKYVDAFCFEKRLGTVVCKNKKPM